MERSLISAKSRAWSVLVSPSPSQASYAGGLPPLLSRLLLAFPARPRLLRTLRALSSPSRAPGRALLALRLALSPATSETRSLMSSRLNARSTAGAARNSTPKEEEEAPSVALSGWCPQCRPQKLSATYISDRIVVSRTGCQWSSLPVENSSYKTVHYFGTWLF